MRCCETTIINSNGVDNRMKEVAVFTFYFTHSVLIDLEDVLMNLSSSKVISRGYKGLSDVAKETIN